MEPLVSMILSTGAGAVLTLATGAGVRLLRKRKHRARLIKVLGPSARKPSNVYVVYPEIFHAHDAGPERNCVRFYSNGDPSTRKGLCGPTTVVSSRQVKSLLWFVELGHKAYDRPLEIWSDTAYGPEVETRACLPIAIGGFQMNDITHRIVETAKALGILEFKENESGFWTVTVPVDSNGLKYEGNLLSTDDTAVVDYGFILRVDSPNPTMQKGDKGIALFGLGSYGTQAATRLFLKELEWISKLPEDWTVIILRVNNKQVGAPSLIYPVKSGTPAMCRKTQELSSRPITGALVQADATDISEEVERGVGLRD